MEKRVIAVLRSSPDFSGRHVQALQRQLAKWAPEAKLTCLADVNVPGVECISLQHAWPDWWCKMEIFRPDIRGDFLLTDLDNIFVGPLDDILGVKDYTTQLGESNALAYMTEDMRAAVWDEWIRDPQAHMNYWHPVTTPIKGQFGDAGFIKAQLHAKQHWEEMFPNQVINIALLNARKHSPPMPLSMLRSQQLPPNARVILCWRPWRPWRVPMLRRFGMYDF